MNRELLEKFVALAPQEWEADCNEWAWFATPTGGVLRAFLDDDSASARAIVFLLDYLESKGLRLGPVLWEMNAVEGARYTLVDAEDSEPDPNHEGATRIESLVRACIALWEAR